jgi:hypothetical protein
MQRWGMALRKRTQAMALGVMDTIPPNYLSFLNALERMEAGV